MADIFVSLSQIKTYISNLSFTLLLAFIWGTFLAFSIVAVLSCALSQKFRSAPKTPYYALTNVFTAFTLALFLAHYPVSFSLTVATLFWVVGYLIYGLLHVFRVTPQRVSAPVGFSSLPVMPRQEPFAPAVPSSEADVRMEHALSMTERLRKKALSKFDRTEVEKIYAHLNLMQRKGTLAPTEAELLNENFNTLLKLMAKYNV